MVVILSVGVGGAAGAILRWLISQAISGLSAPAFWATLFVNVVGCILMGFLVVYLDARWPSETIVRPGILVGLLGGFTTYSAFSMEAVGMLAAGLYSRAAVYILSTLILCILATWAGLILGRSA
ncbi:MAG: fluoride efflux transporter CrcB [Acidiferrobacteraceae bacterium]|nr:fluoride efflux transporter CrcB [Acidiferrobacteraceae bacterium]